MPSDCDNRMDYSRYKVDGYPVRHREKNPFSPQFTLDMNMRRMMIEIRRMDSRLGEFMLSEDDYLTLANEAYASNIHWSTKIEGNRMTMEEVRELTRKYTSGEARESPVGPVQEILNHLGSMFSDSLFRMPWSVETVKKVHFILMRGVGQTEPGRIRDVDVSVTDPSGFEYFIACPHGNVEAELERLVDWVNCSPLDEFATATAFFHEFESIHPFEDGNGRTGRVLFQAILRELGLRNCGLCKFEEKLLSDTGTYYDLLAYTDRVANYTPLIYYVIESLHEAYKEAVLTFSEKDRLHDMEENTRKLVIKAREAGSFGFQEACDWIPLGEASIRSRLDTLVDLGILGKEGRTRGMRYVFLDPFRDLKREVGETPEHVQTDLGHIRDESNVFPR